MIYRLIMENATYAGLLNGTNGTDYDLFNGTDDELFNGTGVDSFDFAEDNFSTILKPVVSMMMIALFFMR